MRLFEFDFENLQPGKTEILRSHDPNDMNYELSNDIEDIINTHCSEIISIYQKTHNFLYRGDRDHSEIAFVGNSRTDRKVLGGYSIYKWGKNQAKVDKWYMDAGFKAQRSNSIFCTSSEICASGFARNSGQVYIIFPFNGFSFTWSPKISDPYNTLRGYDPEQEEQFDNDFIKFFGYTDKNLPAAIESGNEVMITGKYLAINSMEENSLRELLR